MGLAERRGIEGFKSYRLAELTAEIQKHAGFAVPLDIKWDEIAYDGQGRRFDELWTKIFFQPVIDAFKQIGRDPMGADAIKSGVKQIVFSNSRNTWSASAVAFEEGVVMIDHCYTNVDEIKIRTDQLVKLLEKAL